MAIWPSVRGPYKQGLLKEAVGILSIMERRGIRADSYTYASLLQQCADMNALAEGELLHTRIIQTGFINPDIFLGTKLVLMYAKCGSLPDARRALGRMPQQNAASWTAIIATYARQGHAEEALKLFYEMQQMGIRPNKFTLASVLPACADLGALEHGKKVHGGIIRTGFQADLFVGSSLVDMYAKCRRTEDARQVFDEMSERNVVSWNAMIGGYARNGLVDEGLKLSQKMPERNVVSWNAMIAGYVHNGRFEESLKIFKTMQLTGTKPNLDTFATVLPACTHLAALSWGKEVHGHIIRRGFHCNIFVGSALVDIYAKCGHIHIAHKVFESLPEQNVVSWNAMISGYVQNRLGDEVLKVFQKMPERDVVSWNVMIAGYAQNRHASEALELFERIPERDLVSWNAMISTYAHEGHVGEATKLFQKLPKRNVVSWTAMIAGYAQNVHFVEALNLFQQMQLIGAKPNSDTFASVLPACANLAALRVGRKVHEEIIRRGFEADLFVGNALVDMYAKCGSIGDAWKAFNRMSRRDVVSWTAMIVGYAMHGSGIEALQLFEQMQQCGTKPDPVTFVGVLSACCHAGLVDEGRQYFECMIQDYQMTPAVEHYCCMVDLLGRAGHLVEAHNFIKKMPIKPNAATWGSLLSACRIHVNMEVGKHVAECLFESDTKNSAYYVLLSNMYAAAGRWDGVQKVRKIMKDRRAKRVPGCSWVEVNKEVCVFLVGAITYTDIQKLCQFACIS